MYKHFPDRRFAAALAADANELVIRVRSRWILAGGYLHAWSDDKKKYRSSGQLFRTRRSRSHSRHKKAWKINDGGKNESSPAAAI